MAGDCEWRTGAAIRAAAGGVIGGVIGDVFGDVIGEDIADDLLAVVREGLSNVARHAQASKVEVRVEVTKDSIIAQVSDDGLGMPAGTGRRSGLSNLGERAERYGGSCTTSAVTRTGTRLTWQVPHPSP